MLSGLLAKFPVVAPEFPAPPKFFPVPLVGEISSNVLYWHHYLESPAFRVSGAPGAATLENSLFFSLLAENLGKEMGSTATASATTQPTLRRIIRFYARYYRDIGTHRSLEIDAPVWRSVQRIGSINAPAFLG
jgi:hypothetical protein